MPWGANTSIRSKLLAMTMAVSITAILVVSIAYGYLGARQSHSAMAQELQAISDVVGANTAAAILFRDSDAADTTLRSLDAKPAILAGRIVLPDGEVFAEYERDPDQPTRWRLDDSIEGIAFFENTVELRAPIVFDGQRLGSIRIKSSLARVEEERRTLFLVGGIVMLLAAGIAFALSGVLGRVIAKPVESLAGAIQHVSENRDYAVRVDRPSTQELGDLIDGFNHMLSRIDQQHEELERYRNHLENLVEQRTKDLEQTNEQLRRTVDELEQAKNAAEEASRAKSAFLANMSHELRTPLNAVLGFAEILRDELFGELGHASYRSYAEDIHASGEHLLTIINDVLDVARMDTGKFKLAEEMTELSELAESAVRMVRSDAEQKGVALHAGVDDCAIRVYCDPVRLRQVLLNLLANAIKFTPDGGAVSFSAELGPGELIMEIVDTGIGIAEDDIPKVLEPFGQVETPFAREYQGAGLGLAVSKSIVEAHEGELTISSTLGEGTTVTVTLPMHRVQEIRAAE